MDQSLPGVSPAPSDTAAATVPRQHHFVLVHGAGHGGWCWYKVRRLLEASGHLVSCLDLAGAGIDRGDPDAIRSMEEYDRPLHDFMSGLPDNQKVVLVGHSAGGLSVTRATLEFPGKVAAAGYVAATMLRSGFCSQEDVSDGAPEFGDGVLDVTFGAGPDAAPTSATVRPQFQREILYHMSPEEDSTLASMLIRPCPLGAMLSARFGCGEEEEGGGARPNGLRTVYVKTLRDKVITPRQQEAMIRRWPPSRVVEIDTDHSPFFSAPAELVAILVDAAMDAEASDGGSDAVTVVHEARNVAP